MIVMADEPEVEAPVAVVIRMPKELHEAVKAKAAKDDRSAAAAMRQALRQYVDPHDPWKDPSE